MALFRFVWLDFRVRTGEHKLTQVLSPLPLSVIEPEVESDDAATTGRKRVADGVSGEYAPEPIEDQVPRLRGTGLAGVPDAPLMDHHQHILAVRNGELGSIHSWELATAVDGPGTRLTVFMSGCPLRCQYCHNPDTFKMKDGHPVLLSDLVDRVMRYQAVFNATGGGLTVSGGEAMMQPKFVLNLFKQVHLRGVHTTLDTSGFLGTAFSDQDLKENVDLVLLDVKSGDPEIYKSVTGRPLAPTLQFGDRLSELGIPVWARFVQVPGLTDGEKNIKRVAEIISAWPNVQRAEVLPFHQMARDKWSTLGLKYTLEDTQPPEAEEVENTREIFRSMGIAKVF